MVDNICQGLYASTMAWEHRLDDIIIVFHAFTSQCLPITGSIYKGFQTLTWFLCIQQAMLNSCMYNIQRHARITRGVYASFSDINVGQSQEPKDKAYKHLTCHAHIQKAKLYNEMQDLQSTAYVARGVF